MPVLQPAYTEVLKRKDRNWVIDFYFLMFQCIQRVSMRFYWITSCCVVCEQRSPVYGRYEITFCTYCNAYFLLSTLYTPITLINLYDVFNVFNNLLWSVSPDCNLKLLLYKFNRCRLQFYSLPFTDYKCIRGGMNNKLFYFNV